MKKPTDPLQLALNARTHFIPFIAAPPERRVGWFGDGAARGSLAQDQDFALAAIVDAGRLVGGASDWIALYVSNTEPGECFVQREATLPPVTNFQLQLGEPQPETPWAPDIPQLGQMGCKLGGRPGYLQHELTDEPKLHADGYEFLLQLDPENGPMPPRISELLCDGGLYLFAQRTGPNRDALGKCALYWQF